MAGFGGADVLDVTPVPFASAVASYAAGTLTVGDGTHGSLFQLSGSYAPPVFPWPPTSMAERRSATDSCDADRALAGNIPPAIHVDG